MILSPVLQNIEAVKERIARAAEKAGRRPEEVVLVAVTKEATEEQIIEVLKSGAVADVGENRVQSLIQRLPLFEQFGAKVHFIGRLQTNKVKKILGKVVLIHSLDRESLLLEISKRALLAGITVDVLVEINVSSEPTKGGVPFDQAEAFIEKVLQTRDLNLRGIMMMAPFVKPEETRPYFQKTFNLFDKLKSELRKPDFNILSMGMSNDFEVAVEEGSTMVRIGSAIFKGV